MRRRRGSKRFKSFLIVSFAIAARLRFQVIRVAPRLRVLLPTIGCMNEIEGTDPECSIPVAVAPVVNRLEMDMIEAFGMLTQNAHGDEALSL
jgi:hypothetical protein